MLRINVGCGPSPTAGWVNIDNSPSVVLRHLPVGTLIGSTRRPVWDAARQQGVRYASAKRLPFSDASAEAIYSSHMLEHLSRTDVRRFLSECRRVLSYGGIIRIAVPDLRVIVREYETGRNAEQLIQRLMLADERQAIRRIFRFTGHRWMYDGESLRRTITEAGFRDTEVLPAGSTMIPDPGALNLRERENESVYVEARR